MATGAVHQVVICAPSVETLAPCPAGSAPSVVSGYLVSPDSASLFDAAVGPYDFANGAEFWAYAFITTMVLYIGARIYGHIIEMAR